MVFFWDGIFSQWHKHNMVIEGILYNTCEQYMMAEKARLFDDLECLELIMEATNPKEQKKLGRLVKNFDLSPWARTVIDLIQKNWSIPPAQMVRTEDTVEIAVVILKNGQIFSAAIVRHSDNRTFDQAALEAVEGSAPLPPLPGGFPAASVEISFVFAQQW